MQCQFVGFLQQIIYLKLSLDYSRLLYRGAHLRSRGCDSGSSLTISSVVSLSKVTLSSAKYWFIQETSQQCWKFVDWGIKHQHK